MGQEPAVGPPQPRPRLMMTLRTPSGHTPDTLRTPSPLCLPTQLLPNPPVFPIPAIVAQDIEPVSTVVSMVYHTSISRVLDEYGTDTNRNLQGNLQPRLRPGDIAVDRNQRLGPPCHRAPQCSPRRDAACSLWLTVWQSRCALGVGS